MNGKFAAVLSAALLSTALIIALLLHYPGDGGERAREAEALPLPIDVSLLFTDPAVDYDRIDGSFVVIHENIIDSRRQCEFCTVVEFQNGPSADVPEVSWTSDRDFVLTGARKLTFYAMGEEGQEKVQFKVVGKKMGDRLDRLGDRLDRLGIQFEKSSRPVTLTNEWQKFEVDLTDSDLQGVAAPFGLQLQEGRFVYLKGLVIEDEPAEEPLETEEVPNEEEEDDL
jgi:hypothetical protein